MFTPTHPTTSPLPGAAPLPGLAGEIGKRTPFSLPEQEAYLNLLRTAAHLSAPFADLLRHHDLSEATYNILRILRGSLLAAQAGHSPYHGRTCSAIGHEMITQVPDVTRLVDRLERQGLAERCRCDKDRRIVYVKITPPGLSLLTTLDQPLLNLHKQTLGHLSPAELSTLSQLLTKARTPTTQTAIH
jgi:DNA-binding MarR family transcriptional regulator